MLYQTVPLKAAGIAEEATLTLYVPDNSPEVEEFRRRPGVIICPGGGYRRLSFREAEPVALRLNALGLNAFVLHYSVDPVRYPAAQLQLALAIHTVKRNAQAWLTDAGRVFVAGFSAGGHLAASLGILWHKEGWAQALGLDPDDIRPRGMVLSYPVITSGEFAHRDSFLRLLGERYEELKDSLSLEKQVTDKAVPAFLWHTYEDSAVPVENSLLLALELRSCGVPLEMHIYPKGGHGLSLANDQVNGPDLTLNIRPECQGWIDMAARWVFSF